MKPPFGNLPEAQPRFRRPGLSAGRRQLARSALHMTFLLVWFGVMLICTPLGGWLIDLFNPDPVGVTPGPTGSHQDPKQRAALALFQEKNYSAAIQAYGPLHAARVGEPTSSVNLIRSYLEMGQFDYVRQNFQKSDGNDGIYFRSAISQTLRQLMQAEPTQEHWRQALQVAGVAGNQVGLREIALAYLQKDTPPALRPQLEKYVREYRF